MKDHPITDRLWAKAVQYRVPLTMAFELLPLCNLSCKMCYVRKTPAEVKDLGGLLDGAYWIDLLRQSKELGLMFPLLTGGEPFLHPDFRSIYESAVKMGLQVSINSNGTMIDRDTARWLSQVPPVRINMTLYGASEETYHNLCGNGDAFRRVREAVALCKEYGVRVKFNYSATPENAGDIEAVIAYAKQVDSPVQIATYMFPPVRRDPSMIGHNNRLSPEEAALARVQADFFQGDPRWFYGQYLRFRHFVPLDQIEFHAYEGPGIPMTCRAGACSMWIDWQGNAVNCGMYGSAKTSLRDITVAEAWEQILSDTKAVRYAPYCGACPNRYLCHACIAMVCNECGDPNGRPEYLCRYNEASARYYAEYAKRIDPAQLRDDSDAAPAELAPDLCGLDL